MLYELIIAFALTTLIAIFLLNTAFKLSDKNGELVVRSKIEVIQEDYTARFYNDIMTSESIYYLTSASGADDHYCSFSIDGKEVKFGVNTSNNTIYYNGYETELPDGIVPVDIYCDSTYDGDLYTSIFKRIKEGNKNSVIVIKVELADKILNKNYYINIMHLYEDFIVTYK